MTWKKIISIELVKLLRPGNYILLSLFLLLYTGSFITSFYLFKKKEGDFPIGDLINGLSSMEAGLIGFFMAVFVIMNIGKEYSEGTLRKNIIDGYTRDQFFIGKLLLLLIFIIAAFIFGKLTLLLGGLALDNLQNTIALFTPPFLINSFIDILYSGIFALFLIYLTRNITISIVIYFVWRAIEGLIIGIQQFFEGLIGIEQFMPLASINIVLTTTEIINFQSIIITTLYILIMLSIPYYLFLKRDIK